MGVACLLMQPSCTPQAIGLVPLVVSLVVFKRTRPSPESKSGGLIFERQSVVNPAFEGSGSAQQVQTSQCHALVHDSLYPRRSASVTPTVVLLLCVCVCLCG